MIACNVDIFTRDLEFKSHTNVSAFTYNEDYLSPEVNQLIVERIDVELGDVIRLEQASNVFYGFVSDVTEEINGLLQISYKSLLTLFDFSILFDTNLQNTNQTLENYISRTILNTFDYTDDTAMRLCRLTTTLESETVKWGFNLKSELEDSHYCVVNFLKTIVIRAFEKYSIRVLIVPDIANKVYNMYIGVDGNEPVTFEADLPNITEKRVTVRDLDNQTNKIIVYNEENYSTKVVYYRHTDNTFDKVNADRITPVVQDVTSTAPMYEDDMIVVTFEEMAWCKAEDAFASVEYDNLIELTMAFDDNLYFPMSMSIGQVANVISEGKQYVSVLSGRTVESSTTVTLIFGLIRTDLTKQIRRGTYGY